MLSLCVSNDKLAKESAARLRDRCRERGISTFKELFTAMENAGLECTRGGIQNVYYGKTVPNIATAVPICLFLDWSLDVWFLGVSRRKMSATEIKQIVGEMILDAGGEVPANDPTVAEVVRLLAKIETQEQRQMVIRVVKSIVGES